jgi:NADH:ubiquinone oxidoreductase subunit
LAHSWVHHNVSTLKAKANILLKKKKKNNNNNRDQKNKELGTQASKLARSQQLESQ